MTQPMLISTSASSWYTSEEGDPELTGDVVSSVPELVQKVFEDAVMLFKSRLNGGTNRKVAFDNLKATSMLDVERAVLAARAHYDGKKSSKVRKYLTDFSRRVCFYGNIMDVLVQHHPEYVSLAWGAMKLLFVAVMNHENVLTALSTGLCRIADALPRAQLAAILYPTKRMLQAVAIMYAQIIRFLMRALEWFQESKLSHALHSLTRPAELRYDDLVGEISHSTSSINNLALASSQAEQRDMHLKIQGLKDTVEELKGVITGHLSSNDASLYEIRQLLSGIQASQVISMLSSGPLLDHTKSLQYCLSMRSRRALKPSMTSYPFWLTPKIQTWNSAPSSSLIMIKGAFKDRFQVKDFCTNIVELLRNAQIPTIWILRTMSPEADKEISTIDLLKNIVLQAFHLTYGADLDSTLPSHLGSNLSAKSEDEWFYLLGSVLERLPQVYIVIDMEVLSSSYANLTKDSSWPSAFLTLFERLKTRGFTSIIKVVLVSYGSQVLSQMAHNESKDLLVSLGRRTATRKPIKEKVRMSSQKDALSLRTRGRSQGLEKANRLIPFVRRSHWQLQ